MSNPGTPEDLSRTLRPAEDIENQLDAESRDARIDQEAALAEIILQTNRTLGELSPQADDGTAIAEGLEAALAEITQQARRTLGELSPRSSEEAVSEHSNPLFGVNLQRGTDYDDLDYSLFDYGNDMDITVPAGEGNVTHEMVNDEISRMRQSYTENRARGQSGTGTAGRSPYPSFARPTNLFRKNFSRELENVDEGPETINEYVEPRVYVVTGDEGSTPQRGNSDGDLASRMSNMEQLIQSLLARDDRREPTSGTPVRPPRQRRVAANEDIPRRKYLDLGLAIKNVKTFDGNDPNKLEPFIRSYEGVWEKIHPDDRETLLMMIQTGKLEDRAAAEMRVKDVMSLGELTKELRGLYSQPKSIASLQYEFCLLRQEPGESVSSYATRVERLTAELITKQCEEIEPEGARYVERLTRRSAQLNFENGLHEGIQTIVRARNYYGLHESVVGAIEVENLTNGGRTALSPGEIVKKASTRRSMPAGDSREAATRQTGNCYACGNAGHLARDCPRKSSRRSLPMPVGKKEVGQVELFCHYCGRSGHPWRDCMTRLRDQGRKPQQQELSDNQETEADGGERTVGSFHVNVITAKRSREKEVCGTKLGTVSGAASDFRMESPMGRDGMLTLKADTGAQVSIINEGALRPETRGKASNVTITGIGGVPVKALCAAIIELKTPLTTISHEFHVIPDSEPLGVHGFLGMDFIRKHNVDIIGGEYIKVYGHSMPLINGKSEIKFSSQGENIDCVAVSSRYVGVLERSDIAEVAIPACVTAPDRNTCEVTKTNTAAEEIEVDRPMVTPEPHASAAETDNGRADGSARDEDTVSEKNGVARFARLKHEVDVTTLDDEEAQSQRGKCSKKDNAFGWIFGKAGVFKSLKTALATSKKKISVLCPQAWV